jgi:hypothetical protein
MDTIEVARIRLKDGTFVLKYPTTPTWLWNMEGYYSVPTDDRPMCKLSTFRVELLLP